MLESFSALLFFSEVSAGAGSIPEGFFFLYLIASLSFPQRTSLILPHSEGDPSDWNMLPVRMMRPVTSLSLWKHFVVGWASVLPAGKLNAQSKRLACLSRSRRQATAFSIEIIPSFHSWPENLKLSFKSCRRKWKWKDLHNHSLGYFSSFQWSPESDDQVRKEGRWKLYLCYYKEMATSSNTVHVKEFGQASGNGCRSQAVSEFLPFRPFPGAAPPLCLNIPAGQRFLEPLSSLLSSIVKIFSPCRSLKSGKLLTFVASRHVWSKHLIHCDSRPAILLRDAGLLLPLVKRKASANKSLHSHFCFGCWKWSFCPTFATQ